MYNAFNWAKGKLLAHLITSIGVAWVPALLLTNPNFRMTTTDWVRVETCKSTSKANVDGASPHVWRGHNLVGGGRNGLELLIWAWVLINLLRKSKCWGWLSPCSSSLPSSLSTAKVRRRRDELEPTSQTWGCGGTSSTEDKKAGWCLGKDGAPRSSAIDERVRPMSSNGSRGGNKDNGGVGGAKARFSGRHTNYVVNFYLKRLNS